jgi:hypothetical protein
MTTHHSVELLFRFAAYVMFGLTLETLFSIHGIEVCLGMKTPLHRRMPKRYLEGFVSAYMIPLHGLGMLFLFEPACQALAPLHWTLRFVVWALAITGAEVAWGWILRRTVGFYPWDYYKESRFRIFREGYTLWTLVPLWGTAGLVMEWYSGLVRHLSPSVAAYVLG